MFKLTEFAIAHIRESIAQRPLQADELRRVGPMGNLFVSIGRLDDEVRIDGWEYWHQYSLKIDGVNYHFYGGAPLDV